MYTHTHTSSLDAEREWEGRRMAWRAGVMAAILPRAKTSGAPVCVCVHYMFVCVCCLCVNMCACICVCVCVLLVCEYVCVLCVRVCVLCTIDRLLLYNRKVSFVL